MCDLSSTELAKGGRWKPDGLEELFIYLIKQEQPDLQSNWDLLLFVKMCGHTQLVDGALCLMELNLWLKFYGESYFMLSVQYYALELKKYIWIT